MDHFEKEPSLIADVTDETVECTEVRSYFWEKYNDYTSLFSTMCIFAVIHTVIITLGIVGNVMVILSVFNHPSLQTVQNMLTVSLSCSDIIVCLVSGTFTPISAYYKVWFFGKKMCQGVPVIQGAAMRFSTFMFTAISIDRYCNLQWRSAKIMMVFCFILAFAISFPMYFINDLTEHYDEDGNQFCSEFCVENWDDVHFSQRDYGTYVFFLQFVVPFFIITFCSVMTYVRYGKIVQRTSDNNQQEAVDYQLLHGHNRRRQANQMLIATIAVCLYSRMTAVVFNFLRDYSLLPAAMLNVDFPLGIIAHVITMSSTVLTPVLYTLLNDQLHVLFLYDHAKEFIKNLCTNHHITQPEPSTTESMTSMNSLQCDSEMQTLTNATTAKKTLVILN